MSPQDGNSENLGGGFDESLYGKVGRAELGDVPSGDSVEPTSMLRRIARYLSPRLEDAPDSVRNCVFIRSADLETDRSRLGASKRHRHLTRSRKHDPFGRLHLVASTLDEAASIELDCDDLDELHDWLEHAGLTYRPTAWVEVSLRNIVWYPEGLESESASFDFALPSSGRIDDAAIEKALRIFHEKVARVPASSPSFWSEPLQHVPCHLAEKEIQKALNLALDIHFHQDTVVPEVPLKGSKVDFVIYQVGSGPPTPACALELKVFREKHHHAVATSARRCAKRTNTLAIRSGIKQAAVARDEIGSMLAHVAAFDMRAVDDAEIMDAAASESARLNVRSNRYFMYNSKEAYRDAATAPPAPPPAPAKPRKRVRRSEA